MRTEIKAALVLGLFGILGAVIWGINSGQKNRIEIPLDVTPDDVNSTSGVKLAFGSANGAASGFEPIVTTPAAKGEDEQRQPSRPFSYPDNLAAAADANNPVTTGVGGAVDERDPGLPPLARSEQPGTEDPESEHGGDADAASDPIAVDTSPDDSSGLSRTTAEVKRTPGDTDDQPLQPERDGDSRLNALSPSPNAGGTYVLHENDTFISIARAKLGHEKYWKAIQAANPDLDPLRLQPDTAIKLPSQEAIAAMDRKAAAPAVKTGTAAAGDGSKRALTYVVAPGDTLSSIARNILKDESKWYAIYALNRDKLNSPDHIVDGTELRIPDITPKKLD